MIAVASRSFSRHPVLRGELLERYPHVTFNDAGRSLKGDELIAFLRGHERAITALERIDDALLAALPELRVISKYGVGLDMVDLTAMAARGVRLGWEGGVNKRSVAELVVAAAISLLHLAATGTAEVKGGGWRQLVGRQLTGKRVGIIGYGHIGRDVGRLMQAFDCTLLIHDVRDVGEPRVALDELLASADVVTIHVPLDDSTRGMLSRERLARMQSNAVLINMARGGLIDETAVKEMLRDGRLAGAAFDVFEPEPPVDTELLALPNFLPTPHIGGSSEEAILAMGRAAIVGLESARPVADYEELWAALRA
jgi:phosphoglycerate dehydrogenase-like enzyme